MKQWMKKSLAACLALVMCLTLAACGGKEGETPAEESVNVRVAALKGPTAMGMVKLMSDYAPVEEALEDKENVVTAGGGNTYEFTGRLRRRGVPQADAGGAGHRLRAGQPGLRAV